MQRCNSLLAPEVVAARVSAVLKIEAGQIEKPGKERQRVNARSLFCFWAVRELGIGLSDLARKFRLSSTAVSLSVKRGEKLAEAKGFRLLGGAKIKLPAAAG